VVKNGRGARELAAVVAAAEVVAEQQANEQCTFEQQWKETKGIKNESQCED